MSDSNKVCRVCLSKENINSSIFSYNESNKMTFAESIMLFTPIMILPNDQLPKKICNDCADCLKSYVTFRDRCIKSDSILKECSNVLIEDEKHNDDCIQETILSMKSEPVELNEDQIEYNENSSFGECENVKVECILKESFVKCENEPEIQTKSTDIDTVSSDHDQDMKENKSKDRIYSCKTCDKTFLYKNNLRRHELAHMGYKPNKCDICDKTFSHKSDLKVHSRIHSGLRPFVCESCGKSFTRKSHLDVHLAIHSGIRPFECDSCPKSFSTRYDLLAHARIHKGLRAFACEICGKAYTKRSILVKHAIVHTGEKPYECIACGKAFAHASSLATHKRVHSGEKPYKCEVCGKTYAQKNSLLMHATVHDGQKLYKCNQCPRTYLKESTMLRHQKVHDT